MSRGGVRERIVEPKTLAHVCLTSTQDLRSGSAPSSGELLLAAKVGLKWAETTFAGVKIFGRGDVTAIVRSSFEPQLLPPAKVSRRPDRGPGRARA